MIEFSCRVTIGEFVATGCGQSKKKAKHSAAKENNSLFNCFYLFTRWIEYNCTYKSTTCYAMLDFESDKENL